MHDSTYFHKNQNEQFKIENMDMGMLMDFDTRNYKKKLNIEARKMVNDQFNQEALSSDEFIGQMSSIKIECKDTFELQKKLYENYKIIVPIIEWEDNTLLRFSIQTLII